MHRLLGTAFQYAVEWVSFESPVPGQPMKSTQNYHLDGRVDAAALDSRRISCIRRAPLVGACQSTCGLTPKDIDFDAVDGIGTFVSTNPCSGLKNPNQVDDNIIKVSGQAGTQHYFPHFEEYQSVFLPPLHDLL
ncbi:MAG: hypothetical protein ACLT3Y_11465 [Ruminococcus callidus]